MLRGDSSICACTGRGLFFCFKVYLFCLLPHGFCRFVLLILCILRCFVKCFEPHIHGGERPCRNHLIIIMIPLEVQKKKKKKKTKGKRLLMAVFDSRYTSTFSRKERGLYGTRSLYTAVLHPYPTDIHVSLVYPIATSL